jgi:hypothetical protein
VTVLALVILVVLPFAAMATWAIRRARPDGLEGIERFRHEMSVLAPPRDASPDLTVPGE